MALGSTQPLTEMSIRSLPGGKKQPAHKADNLTAICEVDCLENMGASKSHNPAGLYDLLLGQLYHFFIQIISKMLVWCIYIYIKHMEKQ
jgi:hypothetical protein